MARLGASPGRPGRLCGSWLPVALLASAGLHGALGPGPPAPTIRLSPETVRMDAFYSGTKVQIEGTAPPGTDVLVVIRGPEESLFLNRKARVGPVWLNVDRVHVAGVPSLFLRLGAGDLHALLDQASIEAYQLDDSAIKSRMSCRIHCRCRADEATRAGADPAPACMGVQPDEAVSELIRTSYLALKAQEGTFRTWPDAVRVAGSAAGVTRYQAEVDWPRKARPGSYRVEVLACRDRSVLGRVTAVLPVVEVGLPARMGALARTHPAPYGMAAVLAAVIAGLAVDCLARRRWRVRRAASRPAAAPAVAPLPLDPALSKPEEELEEPVGVHGSGEGRESRSRGRGSGSGRE